MSQDDDDPASSASFCRKSADKPDNNRTIRCATAVRTSKASSAVAPLYLLLLLLCCCGGGVSSHNNSVVAVVRRPNMSVVAYNNSSSGGGSSVPGEEEDHQNNSNNSSGGAAVVQVKVETGGEAAGDWTWCRGVDRQLMQLGLALHKCEPPFVAEATLELTCSDTNKSTQEAANFLLADFLLNQNDPSIYNQTYKVCARRAADHKNKSWKVQTFLYLPPNDNGRVVHAHAAADVTAVTGDDRGSDDDDRAAEHGGGSAPDRSTRSDLPQVDEAVVTERSESILTQGEDGLFGDYTFNDWSLDQTTDWVLNRVRRQEAESVIPRILDMRLSAVSAKTSYTDDGRITVLEGENLDLLLVGSGLSNNTNIKLTTSVQNYSDKCGYEASHTKTSQFKIEADPNDEQYARVIIPGKELNYYSGDNLYFVCVEDPARPGQFYHQGQNKHLQIEVYSLLLPTWLSVIFLCVLLCLSGLFSGLNLGLMSLDQTELRIVMNTGSEKEKSYAKAIMPIRGMGNFLLCSILLGNVLVNNTLTILLDTLTGGGGIVAVIGATLGIVVFGEIIPQAICSRHGLAVGANTIWLTKFFMIATAPLAFPISKILDKILGAEIGTVYNRERLMELIKVTDKYTDLEKDEVNIVTGALVLKKKTVKDVMTKLDDCYMLPINTMLNFETVSEIKEQGYSRIPVYEGERSNVKHILFAKDLLFIDPDDNKPLEEICKFYKNDVNFVYQDTALTDMFDEFKSGEKGHMAMVQEVNTEGDGDPYYETVGLLTLEDIIEEIIQQEINDETDVWLDNKKKKKRKRQRPTQDADFKMFLESKSKRVNITPHLSLAILQYLITTVKAFHSDILSPRILQKLLNMDVYREMKLKKEKMRTDEEDDEGVIIKKGKPFDYFVLIIEGRVQITIGQENHKFIEGPFTAFGEQMLEQVMHMPTSPMMGGGMGDPTRGTSVSLSLHSSVNEAAFHANKPLKKTNTQVNIDATSRRAGSADSGMPTPGAYLGGKSQPFVPDYSVKFVTDGIYLKIRKATYLVALKASRMNHLNSDSGVFNEKELDYALERVTEDDNDEFGFTPNCRSPDKYFDPNGIPRSNTGTPTADIRRESLRSSLSMMKSRFMSNQLKRSSTSIDKTKDEFWDGMANPALDRHSEDLGTGVLDTTTGSSPGGLVMNHVNSAAALNSSYNLHPGVGVDQAGGDAGQGEGGGHNINNNNNGKAPLSLPLKQRDHVLEKQSFSEPLQLKTPPHHTTVISVRGTGNGVPPSETNHSVVGGVAGLPPPPALPDQSPPDYKSLGISIPATAPAAAVEANGGGGGVITTATASVASCDSTATGRTTVTTAAESGGDTASKQSTTSSSGGGDGGQLSPNDRTSLLGVNHTVS